MQYKEWLREWLESYVKHSSKQKTYIRYSEIVSGAYCRIAWQLRYERNNATHIATLCYGAFAERELKNGKGVIGKFCKWNYNRYSKLVKGCLCYRSNLGIHSRQNQTSESKRKAGNLFHTYRTEANRTGGTERKESQNVRRGIVPLHRLAYRRIACFGVGRYRFSKGNYIGI